LAVLHLDAGQGLVGSVRLDLCILKMGDRDKLARTRELDQSKWVMPPHGG